MTGDAVHTNLNHRELIEAVPDDVVRPLWSVMIPTYNCARLLERALRSVLDQDPGADRMQIEVVDDCSSADDPQEVVQALSGSRVAFFRQARNVGHVNNFNTCLARSRGHLIHLLHGDDEVRNGFYARMEEVFKAHPEVGAAFSRNIVADQRGHWSVIAPLLQPHDGVLEDWLRTIAVGQRLQAPAMVVRRSVYERLGGFDRRIRRYGEDWEMWVRIAAHYPVFYLTEPLAIYRVHDSSLSGGSVRTGDNMRELAMVVDINREVLPPEEREQLSRAAHRNHALAALRRAHRALKVGRTDSAWAQLRSAYQSSLGAEVLARSALVWGQYLWTTLMRRSGQEHDTAEHGDGGRDARHEHSSKPPSHAGDRE